MSLHPTRQEKLNPILEALKAISGIKAVEQDDWDSNSIIVHIDLARLDRNTFTQPLNLTNQRLKAAMKAAKVQCDFDNMPKKLYEWVPAVRGVKGERVPNGYDRYWISIVVYV